FPMIARIFFRNYSDNIMQFVFVLAMVFLGAGLMQFVGMEGIIGAFLTGLVLNRLIPHVSPLMNRLEFVGNAIFIPYFLIGVGMMIDVNALFSGGSTLKVAIIMTLVAIGSKWIGALISQKLFRMTGNERKMIFGLSSASAAATLAAVLVGHQIIMENGERLINDDVLNGTIVMILVTCIVSSLATERSARKFAIEEKLLFNGDKEGEKELPEQILIPVANPDTIENLVHLALLIRNGKLRRPLVALNVITDSKNIQERKLQGEKNLEKAAMIAASADVKVTPVSRYDLNIASGIIHSAEEYNATNLVIGLHWKANIIDSFFGKLTEGLLKGTFREVMIARYLVPSTTIRKIHVAVPPKAEYETGFVKWIDHVSRIASQLGCGIVFYAEPETLGYVKEVAAKFSAAGLASYVEMEFWNDFYTIQENMSSSHLAVVVCARKGSISYDNSFERLPSLLQKYLQGNSLIVLYPEQLRPEEVHISISDPLGHNE
ncbi:MAG: cation:proton antiporter, partial [Bacteroidales bacterium]|nr:cation:proton antiporter [Bacteroidales bacterium]